MIDTPGTASFNANYKLLKETADWLSQQKEPDIDQLVPRVESAMEAYKACKARLDAVQATLSRYFEADGESAAAPVNGHVNGNGNGKASQKSRPPLVSGIDDMPS